MPYLNFPSDWPTFISKERIADFIEHYATILKLNVLLDTEVKHAEFDAKSKKGRWKPPLAMAKHALVTENTASARGP